MTKDQIAEYLAENCNLTAPEGCASGTGLREIWSKIFNNGKNYNIPKSKIAKVLASWYADEQNLLDVWNGTNTGLITIPGLSDAEKEFISVCVQQGGREFVPSTKAIAEKHGIKPPEEKNSYYARWDFYDTSRYDQKYLRLLHLIKKQYPKTKAVYFFPGGKEMPPFVVSVLKKIIPPMRFEYSAFAPAKADRLICRENRVSDFASVVRFAGSEQLKVKQGTFDITKAKLAKMAESIGFEEVGDNNGEFAAPKEVRHTYDLKVALPLFLLAMNSGLLRVKRDLTVVPSEDSITFLSRPMHEVAQDLFKGYLESDAIRETHYIKSIMLSDGEYSIPWVRVRLPIFKLLKTCPIGQLVSYADFEKNALIFCGPFFRTLTWNRISVRGASYSYYGYYTPDWSECEAQIIRLILSFCGALGMLDIAYTERTRGFKFDRDDFRVGISGFRITPLGAWILGMTETYEVSETLLQAAEGELIVQPDHTVMISGLTNRVRHETYLAKFLTKMSIDDHVAVYKIDFPGMVKAFDQKITPSQIKEYLNKASSKPLPENVVRSLDDWQAKVGRVKICNVTILETDDELLLQELLHIKSMDKYASDILKHAAVIDSEAKKKVKMLAEKNGWLVK